MNRLKIPLAYADQFYVLREHIGFVRQRLDAMNAEPVPHPDSSAGADSAPAPTGHA